MHETNPYQSSLENVATPTPSQLRKIALRALLLANRTDRLKKVRSKRTARTQEPSIGWVSSYYDKEEDSEVNEVISCLLTRRVLSLPDAESQIETPVPVDAWSLRYRHSKQTRNTAEGEDWKGEVSQYAFEWDSTSTLTAAYRTDAMPSISQEEIDRTWILDTMGQIPHENPKGQLIDIEAVLAATPTSSLKGAADVTTYRKIMHTLDSHIERIGAE